MSAPAPAADLTSPSSAARSATSSVGSTSAMYSGSESTTPVITSTTTEIVPTMAAIHAPSDPSASRVREKRYVPTAVTARNSAFTNLKTTILSGKDGKSFHSPASSSGYPGGKCVACGDPGMLIMRNPSPVASALASVT